MRLYLHDQLAILSMHKSERADLLALDTYATHAREEEENVRLYLHDQLAILSMHKSERADLLALGEHLVHLFVANHCPSLTENEHKQIYRSIHICFLFFLCIVTGICAFDRRGRNIKNTL